MPMRLTAAEVRERRRLVALLKRRKAAMDKALEEFNERVDKLWDEVASSAVYDYEAVVDAAQDFARKVYLRLEPPPPPASDAERSWLSRWRDTSIGQGSPQCPRVDSHGERAAEDLAELPAKPVVVRKGRARGPKPYKRCAACRGKGTKDVGSFALRCHGCGGSGDVNNPIPRHAWGT